MSLVSLSSSWSPVWVCVSWSPEGDLLCVSRKELERNDRWSLGREFSIYRTGDGLFDGDWEFRQQRNGINYNLFLDCRLVMNKKSRVDFLEKTCVQWRMIELQHNSWKCEKNDQQKVSQTCISCENDTSCVNKRQKNYNKDCHNRGTVVLLQVRCDQNPKHCYSRQRWSEFLPWVVVLPKLQQTTSNKTDTSTDSKRKNKKVDKENPNSKTSTKQTTIDVTLIFFRFIAAWHSSVKKSLTRDSSRMLNATSREDEDALRIKDRDYTSPQYFPWFRNFLF
jgi:hypothetical protein